jgi:hypothetical protein
MAEEGSDNFELSFSYFVPEDEYRESFNRVKLSV